MNSEYGLKLKQFTWRVKLVSLHILNLDQFYLGRVSLDGVAWFVCSRRPVKWGVQTVFCKFSKTWYPRCKACGHRRRCQRGTHGADARRRPPPRRCARWTRSSRWSPGGKACWPTILDYVGMAYLYRFYLWNLTWLASTVPLMSQRQRVWSSLAERRCPFMFGFQDRPYLMSRCFSHSICSNHFARLTLPSCALSDETPAYTCHWGPAAPLSACWCRTQAPRWGSRVSLTGS